MIIIKLQGGLGNQMFQYAAGSALGIKYKVPVYLDHSFLERNNQSFNGFTARQYGLHIFNISANKFSGKVIDQYFDSGNTAPVYAYKELPVSYDATFKKLKPSVYISGNWQSPMYFKNISDSLRADFAFKKHSLITQQATLINQLSTNNSVAIHVRRGDYLPPTGSTQTYSICDEVYYRKAIEIIRNQIPDPIFFVFSDDNVWSKENLKFDGCNIQFIQKNENADWLDMYLMSICKHNIIANSTFSWWAAWLNANKCKIVIAPKKWFNIVPLGFNLDHLYPKGWRRV